ncbi:hypothetical protein MKEN_00205700 [Mycena kentingensis (nom. inval.)]|nr:hypothetical protein MKEN_00205700 [Mycena kentingensis (nom. inval.)]
MATTINVAAHLDDPAALVNAIIHRMQMDPNPASCAAQLAAYMKNGAVQQKTVTETQKGLEALTSVTQTFFAVLQPLVRVDSQNFKQLAGRKFAPQWQGYFNVHFVNNILPILGSTTVTAAEKQEKIDAFVKARTVQLPTSKPICYQVVDDNEKRIAAVDTLVASYTGLSTDISAFKDVFAQSMVQVGKSLDLEIQQALDAIDLVNAHIKAHIEEGKSLGLVAGALGTVAAGFACTGILAPMTLIFAGLATFFGVSEAEKYAEKTIELQNELAEKEAAKDALVATKAAYDATQPQIASASSNMGSVTAKLTAISCVLKMIKSDVVQANTHLNTARNGEAKDSLANRDAEIKAAAASYGTLKLIVDTFAVGLQQQ